MFRNCGSPRFFFFQAEDGIRDRNVTGVQTCGSSDLPLTARDGSFVTTDSLNASAVYANERAAADLNATVGQQLTLFYGTTNQTLVHATMANIVRDVGTAAYEHRSILFMDLRMAQAAFNESGAVNQI